MCFGFFSDFGVVLGCKFFIKEIYSGSLAREEGTLQEGDTVLKVCSTSSCLSAFYLKMAN